MSSNYVEFALAKTFSIDLMSTNRKKASVRVNWMSV